MLRRSDGVAYVVLLAVPVLAGAFSAYELAGLQLPGWDTISYFASRNHALGAGIAVAATAAWAGFMVWWWHHYHGHIAR